MSEIKITKDIEDAYESGKQEAERIVSDPDKMELFLQRLEQKLDDVPVVIMSGSVIQAGLLSLFFKPA